MSGHFFQILDRRPKFKIPNLVIVFQNLNVAMIFKIPIDGEDFKNKVHVGLIFKIPPAGNNLNNVLISSKNKIAIVGTS